MQSRHRADGLVPDTFPTAGEHDYAGPAPKHLRFASIGEGQFIPRDDWKALTAAQRRFVRKSLDSRGLTLFDREDRLTAIHHDAANEPIRLQPLALGHEFYFSDARFGSRHEITIHIDDTDRETACEVLQEFFRMVQKFGVAVEA